MEIHWSPKLVNGQTSGTTVKADTDVVLVVIVVVVVVV